MDEFLSNTNIYLQTNLWLGLVAVFLGGVLTATNPCVLAMIPLMVSFVAGQKPSQVGPLRSFGFSALFVVGLSITFSALGLIAAGAGLMYEDVAHFPAVWNWILFVVCLVMGLHLLGVLKFSIPVPFESRPNVRGTLGALVLGLLFGIVSAPCAAPVLIVLLTYLASAHASLAYGALLLFLYGLGHSVLILVAGTSMGAARRLIESSRLTAATAYLRKGAGAVIILVGAYFVCRSYM